jgi:glucose-1-phosphate adenylyltransferase
VIPIPPDSASEFGLLKTDEAGRITEFSEKPKGDALEAMRVDTTSFGLSEDEARARPFLASMGIYVFKYDVIERVLAEDTARLDFGKEIIPASIQNYNLQAFLFNGYWEDIGTIAAFYKANLDMTSAIPPFNLFDAEAPMFTRARYLPPSKVDNCEIRDSIISDGCIINGAKINGSVIGLRSRIGEGAHLDGAYMMGADYYQTLEDMLSDREAKRPRIGIGENAIIRRAIIDKNSRIGANVQLLNEAGVEEFDAADGSYYIRDRIIIVPKNALVPDGTVV